uniref:WD repeat-containing protein 74 n=1 Tax=Melanaphis sacchari TaxID=742174 RepID=A0A2H8TKZ7_9HEMI
MAWTYDAVIGFSNGMLKGVELQKNKFKYTNLLEASLKLNHLSNYDENKAILSSKRKILLFDLKNKKMSKKYLIREPGNIVGVLKRNNILYAGVDNGMVVIKPIKTTSIISEKLIAGPHLSCVRQNLSSDKLATGGNENPLKIWDLETKVIEFTAKRPKPDMLQLKQPCYVSDIQFYNNNKVVVSHKHGVVIINL